MSNAFGRYLRRKRTEAGMSLRDAARAMMLSHVYLGEVELGRRGPLLPSRWSLVIESIPGVDADEMQRLAVEDRIAAGKEEDEILVSEIERLRRLVAQPR